MNTLGRRLTALERAAWDRRKRRILRDAFAVVARDRRWTPDQLEREVQAALDDFERMEPELRAMCRQGRAAREVLAWLAAEMGVDSDELLTEVERSDMIGSARR
jgi:hypothetical protein